MTPRSASHRCSAEATTDRFHIVTGGPGAGKTTLIEALERAGYARTVEAGRAIIQEQVARGGSALPWADRDMFAKAMLHRELESYNHALSQDGVVFFDRGLPDIVGYLRLCGLAVPPQIDEACRTHRYNSRVFIAPPWPEIFSQDDERKQTLQEAERTYEAMLAVYPAYGYRLDELPRSMIEDRLGFVLSRT